MRAREKIFAPTISFVPGFSTFYRASIRTKKLLLAFRLFRKKHIIKTFLSVLFPSRYAWGNSSDRTRKNKLLRGKRKRRRVRSLFSLLTANDRPKAEGRNEVEWGRKREAKAKKEIERSPAPCQRMKENHPNAHVKGFVKSSCVSVSNSPISTTIFFPSRSAW